MNSIQKLIISKFAKKEVANILLNLWLQKSRRIHLVHFIATPTTKDPKMVFVPSDCDSLNVFSLFSQSNLFAKQFPDVNFKA